MPEQSSDEATVIERFIDAPIGQVWSMWADPAQFASWYGPSGAIIATARLDVRPGGERVVAMTMQTPGGARTMWFGGVHLEIEEPRLLVCSESITDGDHGEAQSPVTTVRLELAEADGGTRLRLTHVGVPPDSPGASGWTMALDKLVAAFPLG